MSFAQLVSYQVRADVRVRVSDVPEGFRVASAHARIGASSSTQSTVSTHSASSVGATHDELSHLPPGIPLDGTGRDAAWEAAPDVPDVCVRADSAAAAAVRTRIHSRMHTRVPLSNFNVCVRVPSTSLPGAAPPDPFDDAASHVSVPTAPSARFLALSTSAAACEDVCYAARDTLRAWASAVGDADTSQLDTLLRERARHTHTHTRMRSHMGMGSDRGHEDAAPEHVHTPACEALAAEQHAWLSARREPGCTSPVVPLHARTHKDASARSASRSSPRAAEAVRLVPFSDDAAAASDAKPSVAVGTGGSADGPLTSPQESASSRTGAGRVSSPLEAFAPGFIRSFDDADAQREVRPGVASHGWTAYPPAQTQAQRMEALFQLPPFHVLDDIEEDVPAHSSGVGAAHDGGDDALSSISAHLDPTRRAPGSRSEAATESRQLRFKFQGAPGARVVQPSAPQLHVGSPSAQFADMLDVSSLSDRLAAAFEDDSDDGSGHRSASTANRLFTHAQSQQYRGRRDTDARGSALELLPVDETMSPRSLGSRAGSSVQSGSHLLLDTTPARQEHIIEFAVPVDHARHDVQDAYGRSRTPGADEAPAPPLSPRTTFAATLAAQHRSAIHVSHEAAESRATLLSTSPHASSTDRPTSADFARGGAARKDSPHAMPRRSPRHTPVHKLAQALARMALFQPESVHAELLLACGAHAVDMPKQLEGTGNETPDAALLASVDAGVGSTGVASRARGAWSWQAFNAQSSASGWSVPSAMRRAARSSGYRSARCGLSIARFDPRDKNLMYVEFSIERVPSSSPIEPGTDTPLVALGVSPRTGPLEGIVGSYPCSAGFVSSGHTCSGGLWTSLPSCPSPAFAYGDRVGMLVQWLPSVGPWHASAGVSPDVAVLQVLLYVNETPAGVLGPLVIPTNMELYPTVSVATPGTRIRACISADEVNLTQYLHASPARPRPGSAVATRVGPAVPHDGSSPMLDVTRAQSWVGYAVFCLDGSVLRLHGDD